VVDRDDTTVTCVALNDATLDGLLSVMVCHTEDEVGWGGVGQDGVGVCATLDGLLSVMVCHTEDEVGGWWGGW